MRPFHLKIVTPKGIYKEVDIELLNLKTTAGHIGILAKHIPLAAGIEISEMNYIKDEKREFFAIGGGFVYVNDNETTIIANSIESPEEIDINRALAAKNRAEERLKAEHGDMDVLRAETALKKAIIRIDVKGLK